MILWLMIFLAKPLKRRKWKSKKFVKFLGRGRLTLFKVRGDLKIYFFAWHNLLTAPADTNKCSQFRKTSKNATININFHTGSTNWRNFLNYLFIWDSFMFETRMSIAFSQDEEVLIVIALKWFYMNVSWISSMSISRRDRWTRCL